MAFVPDPRIWLHIAKHRVCCISSVFASFSKLDILALGKYIILHHLRATTYSGFSQILSFLFATKASRLPPEVYRHSTEIL